MTCAKGHLREGVQRHAKQEDQGRFASGNDGNKQHEFDARARPVLDRTLI
jgi:hypothetical protein